jgi:alpha-tubulin suppressor-like RCC1 family protein
MNLGIRSFGWVMASLLVLAAAASCADTPLDEGEGTQASLADPSSRLYQTVSMGEDFGCALGKSGQVYCWGSDQYGNLGDNGTTYSLNPIAVSGISNEIAVTAGGYHACALDGYGQIRCWGQGAFGQLGNGTTVATSLPVLVQATGGGALYNQSQVSGGHKHTCSLGFDGSVWCWGNNGTGAVGAGGSGYVTTATYVPLPKLALSVSAGYSHTCALLADHTVSCWGQNSYGQLGDGTTTAHGPGAVPGLTNVVSISSGEVDTCAVLGDHTVKCWGDNSYGQLGIGSYVAQLSPIAVKAVGGRGVLDHIVQVTVGYTHVCGLRDDGASDCWGNWPTASLTPQVLATGTFGSYHSTPTTYIAANGGSTCLRSADGNFWCFGSNANGSLGDGTSTTRTVPTWNTIPAYLSAGPMVVGGWRHACAIGSINGTVSCWGDNSSGQLGDGTTTTRYTPVTVSGITNAIAVSANGAVSCALIADGTVKCWGDDFSGAVDGTPGAAKTTPVLVPGLSHVVHLSAGALHSCAVLADGTARCWGDNNYGEIGDGTTSSYRPVTQVSGLTNAVQISSGSYTTCALRSDSTVACWGDNTRGTIGDGTTTARLTPTAATGVTTARAITAGQYVGCASLADGTVKCWGDNTSGVVGNGSFSGFVLTPSLVQGPVGTLGGVVGITAGYTTACAATTSGAIYCWGDNTFGGIGDGTTTSRAIADTNGVYDAIQVGGGATMCASLANDTVECWGNGYLGNGSTTHPNLSPGVTSISP